MLNLDTHILIDFVRGKLLPHERKAIENNSKHLVISDIVLWEIAKLHAKKRIEMSLISPNFEAVMKFITVLPISSQIAQKSTELDFSSDPADELIAATSVVLNIPLLTRDEKILKSKQLAFA